MDWKQVFAKLSEKMRPFIADRKRGQHLPRQHLSVFCAITPLQ